MAAKLSGPGGGSKYTIEGNAEMNVTPMVDVMLVLLIIFMVAAPLATVSIKLDLPPALPNNSPEKPKPPKVISIQKTGEMFIDQKKTDFPTLIADISAALAVPEPRKETVYIRADKEVHYSQFMQVLNTLQDGGFYKVSLVTEDRI
jgi:biopolymer transport protein ExbD